jgi:hypothetical protein
MRDGGTGPHPHENGGKHESMKTLPHGFAITHWDLSTGGTGRRWNRTSLHEDSPNGVPEV